jgi:hypothetical protein
MRIKSWLKQTTYLEQNPKAWRIIAVIILVAMGGWLSNEFLDGRNADIQRNIKKNQALLEDVEKKLRECQALPSAPCLKQSPRQWLGALTALAGPNWRLQRQSIADKGRLVIVEAEMAWAKESPPSFKEVELFLEKKIDPAPSVQFLELRPENSLIGLRMVATAEFSKPAREQGPKK